MAKQTEWDSELSVLYRIFYRPLAWVAEIRRGNEAWDGFLKYVKELRVMELSKVEIEEGIKRGIRAAKSRDRNRDCYWDIRHSKDVNEIYLDYMRRELRKAWDQFWSEKPDFRWELIKFSDQIPVNPEEIDWTVDDSRTRRYWKTAQDVSGEQFVQNSLNVLSASIPYMTVAQLRATVSLYPCFQDIEIVTKSVLVPISWMRHTDSYTSESEEYEEFYEFMIGWNSRKINRIVDYEIDVWSPTKFDSREFTFESPNYNPFLEILRDRPGLLSLLKTKEE